MGITAIALVCMMRMMMRNEPAHQHCASNLSILEAIHMRSMALLIILGRRSRRLVVVVIVVPLVDASGVAVVIALNSRA